MSLNTDRDPREYVTELVRSYHSTHYQFLMPQSEEAWSWVLDRLELNFGEFLRSVPRSDRIADLACGVGYLEHHLLKNGFTDIHAIDLSEEQVAVARKILEERGADPAGKVKFDVCDVFDYLERSEGLAGAALIDLLEHFPKNRAIQLLRLVRGSLRPGGFLLIRTPNAEHPMSGRFYNDFTHETHFTLRSLRQCLAFAGFQVVEAGYEKLPLLNGRSRAWQWSRRSLRRLGLRVLGKLLGTTVEAFSEDLVSIARK